MCSPSSKNTGLRSRLFWVLALCFCLTPSGTLWAQDSLPSAQSDDSSKAFLQAVKELADSLTPDQRAKLMTILEHYKAEEQAQNDLQTKLSTSWQKEKAKILNDQIITGLISAGIGFLGGYAAPHK